MASDSPPTSRLANLFLDPKGPELVFGIVGGTGVDTKAVAAALERELDDAGFGTTVLSPSTYLRDVGKDLLGRAEPETPEDERIKYLQDVGNELRKRTARGDAAAILTLGGVLDARARAGKPPLHSLGKHAFIFRSLKNPQEVDALRRIYGSSFILIGAHTSKPIRLERLARKIGRSRGHTVLWGRAKEECEHLAAVAIERDEAEGDALGQNVRDTFALSDVFIDADDKSEMGASLKRFVDSLFHHPYNTPSRHEYCMFHAEAARLRSSALGRQVGAVVASDDGEIVAVGSNEVPKFGGGQYWEGDPNDARDFQKGEEVSDRMKRQALKQVLESLQAVGWKPQDDKVLTDDYVDELLAKMKGGLLANTIEFGRVEHAEVAAIMSAATRGTSVRDLTLYTTTFPCHDCTRHIISAGIKRVYYIEPYAKSLGPQLHADAISVDQPNSDEPKVKFLPFIGIGPRIYQDVFRMENRKQNGQLVTWFQAKESPRFGLKDATYLVRESDELDDIRTKMKGAGLSVDPTDDQGAQT